MSINKNRAYVNVSVQPRSSKNAVIGMHNNRLKVAVTVAPTDNKANIALIELLAQHFDIPKSNIKITKGLTSRNKTVFINRPFI